MNNADLFDDSLPKKSHLPEYAKKKKKKLKGWHIGVIIIVFGFVIGVFALPYYVDGQNILQPAPIDMSDKIPIVEPIVIEPPSEEKPPDLIKHDFVGSSERLTLTIDNKPIYRFVVATEEGYMEFQFNCYKDEDGSMKYYGDFRNLEGLPINVAVLKADEIIAEKRATHNQAIIMEGFC